MYSVQALSSVLKCKESVMCFMEKIFVLHRLFQIWVIGLLVKNSNGFHSANEGGECPQIPCSRSPLRWHQPWLLHRTVHLQKWWHLNDKSEESLGEDSVGWFIVAIENPADGGVMSSRNAGQRALLKFAAATAATSIVGCFTPGAFTNQIHAVFRETWFPVFTDLRADPQPLTEACVNLPTIALCNTDSPLWYVDIAIPCNNKGAHLVGWMQWTLTWEVLHMRGTPTGSHASSLLLQISWRDWKGGAGSSWEGVTEEEFQGKWTTSAPEFTSPQPEVLDWSQGVPVPPVPVQQFPTEEGSAQPAAARWSATHTAQATEWVETATERS